MIRLASSANRSPMPADILTISSRSPPTPISSSSFRVVATRSLGADIAVFKVAVAVQASGHVNAVGALFKGLQDVDRVHLARTGNPDDLDVGRIAEPLAAGHVRRGIRAVVATKRHDHGSKFSIMPPSFPVVRRVWPGSDHLRSSESVSPWPGIPTRIRRIHGIWPDRFPNIRRR